ncbi:hypothetical protein FRB94_014192 [Tulasnella sp. JGI-2019a]|nr:hypothetical protein FRB93_005460 [Tulasnella sp. JGI-2019a]KAG9014100.1 hypothetical protein FRB94_014192 [Tulasnella sp. JGI-2019a]KAG9028787.1 hypothetical protein FRB95_006067 [Tulasnella sp. JGI-2019a]
MALSDSDVISTCGGACKLPEELAFSGFDAAECERFIGAVRKYAYLHGKQRDDEWITDLVASCLSGKALKWHVKLSSQIAWNWGSLQEAMVDQFALTVEEINEGSTTSQEAPRIIQPHVPSDESALTASLTGPACFGLIQVQAVELTTPTYINALPSHAGRLYLTQKLNEALRVRFFPSAHPSIIKIVEPGKLLAPKLDHLGITRFLNDRSNNVCVDERFYLTFTDRSQESTSWEDKSCLTKAAVWTTSDNNVVRASWDRIGMTHDRDEFCY